MATNDTGTAPRAVIHKRILEAAEARPDASLAELAADLAGASPALVERVLEEYGDPGRTPAPEPPAEGSPAAHPADEEPMTEDSTAPTAAALTDKQRETLRAIADRPEATQAELAETLGVSRATVNQRVNAIDGFEWADRRAFVERVFGEEAVGGTGPSAPAPEAEPSGQESPTAPDSPSADATAAASDGGQLLDPDDADAVEQLQERLARVERQLGDPADDRPIEDPELLAKVLRAVLADEAITEDEELRVIEAVL